MHSPSGCWFLSPCVPSGCGLTCLRTSPLSCDDVALTAVRRTLDLYLVVSSSVCSFDRQSLSFGRTVYHRVLLQALPQDTSCYFLARYCWRIHCRWRFNSCRLVILDFVPSSSLIFQLLFSFASFNEWYLHLVAGTSLMSLFGVWSFCVQPGDGFVTFFFGFTSFKGSCSGLYCRIYLDVCPLVFSFGLQLLFLSFLSLGSSWFCRIYLDALLPILFVLCSFHLGFSLCFSLLSRYVPSNDFGFVSFWGEVSNYIAAKFIDSCFAFWNLIPLPMCYT